MSIELSPQERMIIKSASDAVGGSLDTPAQLDRFGRVASEQKRMSEPLIVKRGETRKLAQAETLKAMIADPTVSPRLRKRARHALKMSALPIEEQRAAALAQWDAIKAQRETVKGLVAVRDNASGPDAPIIRDAVNVAIQKHMSDLLAQIKEG